MNDFSQYGPIYLIKGINRSLSAPINNINNMDELQQEYREQVTAILRSKITPTTKKLLL